MQIPMLPKEQTKYRLAQAMKVCMKEKPVDRITVQEIVDVCGVTRQTFYRKFLDKYDLINWYFGQIAFWNPSPIWAPAGRYWKAWNANSRIFRKNGSLPPLFPQTTKIA